MATPASNTTTAVTTATAPTAAAQSDMIPSATTLQHAARLALQHDRPILLDYYIAIIGKSSSYTFEDIDCLNLILSFHKQRKLHGSSPHFY